MRDSEIEQWVLHELRLTGNDGLREVCVFASNGVVVLKGTVRGRAKLAAQIAARRANGVIAVINELSSITELVKKRPTLVKMPVVRSASKHLRQVANAKLTETECAAKLSSDSAHTLLGVKTEPHLSSNRHPHD